MSGEKKLEIPKVPSARALQMTGLLWTDPRVSDREMDSELAIVFAEKLDQLLDGSEAAWGLIANAWDTAGRVEDWREAATRWRDEFYHPLLREVPDADKGGPG
jgi:hypothetical protein